MMLGFDQILKEFEFKSKLGLKKCLKIEKKILFIPFLPLGQPSNHESAPPFSLRASNAPSSLRLVSLTGGPRMSALSSTLNRTRVGLRRRVRVRRCHDSLLLTPPPIALPPKPSALLNSSHRPSRLSPSRFKSQRRRLAEPRAATAARVVTIVSSAAQSASGLLVSSCR